MSADPIRAAMRSAISAAAVISEGSAWLMADRVIKHLDAAGWRVVSGRVPSLRDSRSVSIDLATYQQILGERSASSATVCCSRAARRSARPSPLSGGRSPPPGSVIGGRSWRGVVPSIAGSRDRPPDGPTEAARRYPALRSRAWHDARQRGAVGLGGPFCWRHRNGGGQAIADEATMTDRVLLTIGWGYTGFAAALSVGLAVMAATDSTAPAIIGLALGVPCILAAFVAMAIDIRRIRPNSPPPGEKGTAASAGRCRD